MVFNFVKSLASNLQNKGGVPAQVLEAYWNWAKNEHIPYIDTYRVPDEIGVDIDLVSEKLLKTFFKYMGFPITSGEGYTSTKRYYNRQMETLAKRIRWKTTRQCYAYEFYVFMLYGSVIPLSIDNDSYLVELDTDFFDDFLKIPPLSLDYGMDDDGNPLPDRVNLRLDQNLPNYEKVDFPQFDDDHLLDENPTLFRDTKIPGPLLPQLLPDNRWFLDNNNIKGSLTRCFKIKYKPLYIEATNEFWVKDSARAFYNDVILFKRAIEHPYFEPQIYIKGYTAYQAPYVQTFQNEDGTTSSSMISTYIKVGLQAVRYLRVGKGRLAGGYNLLNTSSNPISNANLIEQFDLTAETGQLWTVESSPTQIKITPRIPSNDGIRWIDNAFFSEIALYDTNNQLIFYASFPTVHYDVHMLSSVFFQIDLVPP